jgi:hypothetical protein
LGRSKLQVPKGLAELGVNMQEMIYPLDSTNNPLFLAKVPCRANEFSKLFADPFRVGNSVRERTFIWLTHEGPLLFPILE